MNTKLKTALRRMGYRHMGRNVWGKPVAYHLLAVHKDGGKVKLTNYFHGVNGQPLVYSSTVLSDEDYEESIKLAESATNISVAKSGNSFSFLTKEDEISDLL